MSNSAGTEGQAPMFGVRTSYGSAPDLSVVVPMLDEEGGAQDLIEEIAKSLAHLDFEIIVVDDGSRDGTAQILEAAARRIPQLRVFRHAVNAGQSRAIRTGVIAARSPVVATLDGDGQNDPADIGGLVDALRRDGAPPLLAMVAGERRIRRDAAAKKTASRLANAIRRRILKDGAADTGCGLKAFYRDAFLRLPYFDHSHRYLPALMRREGFEVEFRPVDHRLRAHGASKYTNFGRLKVALADLRGVVWLNSRARSPVEISALEPGRSYDRVTSVGRPRGGRV
jgi:glycosyltransferase involved in cell wall biosynthesis